MKIIHFSDTHLWLWLENTNREEDFYKNFEKVINDILNEKPDYVIHSGDLFHTSKPTNKAISVVISNFLKLQEAWIKVIIIAWNHDTPRLSITTHSFEIFKEFKWFYTFYEPKIEKLEFENVNFVLLPHIHDENIFKQEFKKATELLDKNETFQKQEVQGRKKILKWAYENVSEWKISFSEDEILGISKVSKKNIFISHFWISYQEYEEYTDEISWVNISVEELEILKKFDYVALGHYHKNFSLPWTNISYSWSLEHTSFNQKNYKNGYNIINLWERFEKKVIELETRKMIDLWEINCENIFDTETLINFLEKNLNKEEIKDAIVKISFINMDNKLIFDFRENLIISFFKETFYFEYKKFKKIDKNNLKNIDIKDSWNIITKNFEEFFKDYEIEDKEKLWKEITKLLKENI